MHRNPLFSQENFLVPNFGFDGIWSGPQSDYIKGWLALVGALLLLVFLHKRWLHAARAQTAVLAGLALLAALAYTNFLSYHGPRANGSERLHTHDVFHYTMGSRYFPELGYTHLYEASLVALKEASGDPGFYRDRYFREMGNYRLLRATELGPADEQGIRSRFSPERWEAFKRDTVFFARLVGEARYPRLYVDHGYNPSPVHAMLSRLWTAHGELTRARLERWTLLDPLLLAASVAALAWAFGLRGALLFAIVLLLTQPARWAWTGGALLRTPWLAALCFGVALCHKKRPVAAGLCLGAAAAFRGFPGLVLVGLAAPFLWGVFEDRARARTCLRLGVAAAAAIVVLMSVAPTAAQRTGATGEWLAGIRAHASHVGLNSIGLKPALAFAPGATLERVRRTYETAIVDPSTYGLRESGTPSLSEYYGQVKADLLKQRRAAFVLAVLAGWTLFAFAARRASAAQSLILGVSLIFFAGLNVASYYYGFLALLALYPLAGEQPNPRAAYVMTAALLLLSVADHWIAQVWDGVDVVFGLESLARLFFLLAVLGWSFMGTMPRT